MLLLPANNAADSNANANANNTTTIVVWCGVVCDHDVLLYNDSITNTNANTNANTDANTDANKIK